MKLESPPLLPNNKKLYAELLSDYANQKYADFLTEMDASYLYWSAFKYQPNLPYDDALKAWYLVKFHRGLNSKRINFGHSEFCYVLTDTTQQNLHEFDLKLIGGLYQNPISPFHRAEYLKKSILGEAIASAQIEGAATTTKVAMQLLQSDKSPKNESEQMIVNNWRAIQLINERLTAPLTPELIIEIHATMTVDTAAAYCAGNFRTKAVYIQDHIDGEIAHTPPDAAVVLTYIRDLCDFVHAEKPFLHPIVKSAIIHFMIGFIHPFMDGNGRTARALFYWYLLKKEYTLMKHISISKAIQESRTQYDKAFLKTEKDGLDLTYFINYAIKNLKVAFQNLMTYRDRKQAQQEQAQLMAYQLLQKELNKRQAYVIGQLYATVYTSFNMTKYAVKHKVVRQTARKDLNELVRMGLLKKRKEGREVVFYLAEQEKINHFLAVE